MGLIPTQKSVIGQFVNGRNAQDDFLQLANNHGGTVFGWIDANGFLQGTLALIQRPIYVGTPLSTVLGNFSLSGWGSGATITNVSGVDSTHRYTITAGTSPSELPTVQLTYADGAWPNAPLLESKMSGGTGSITDLTETSTTTVYTITYQGIPIAGSTYIITCFVRGI